MSITPCPSSTSITRGIVAFDPTAFKSAFTSFATVADAALNLSFSLAQFQLNNSCGSLVCDANERETLLNLLVAHITALKDGENGLPPAGIVGHINRAQQGSVSVGAEMGTLAYGQAYYAQTQWGLMYWQNTTKYRRAMYIPAPPVCADFSPYGNGGWDGGGCC